MPCALGIDFGTESTCVGVYLNGTIEIIADKEQEKRIPSCVAFLKSGRLIGETAKAQASRNPENTIFNVKCLLGRNFNDPAVALYKKNFPVHLEDHDGNIKIRVQYQNETLLFSPEEISAMILRKVKEMAEIHLGVQTTSVVIIVPAYYADSQRKATINAGKIAGFNEVHLLNAPTAAAIAYGLNRRSTSEKNIFVLDMGTGKTDLSILKIDKELNFEVKATHGSTHLGGFELLGVLTDYFVLIFEENYGIDLRSNMFSMQKLKEACKDAIKCLCEKDEAEISILNIFNGFYFYHKITRKKFEDLCKPFFSKIGEYLESLMKESGINKSDINDIILVGGCSKISKIKFLITEFFDKKEVCSFIDPEIAVTFGAAVQAAILSGNADSRIEEILLIDVIPASIGIELSNGKIKTIISRNTRIPCKVTETFTTNYDNQPSVSIEIYEGERPNAEENNFLGQFQLVDLPQLPKGEVQIDVVFEVNKEGILIVSAGEKENLKTESVIIKRGTDRFTDKEISQLSQELEDFEKEDKKHIASATFMNNLENFLFSFRESLSTMPIEKISVLDKKKINDICVEMLQWLELNPRAKDSEIDLKREETLKLLKSYEGKIDLSYFE